MAKIKQTQRPFATANTAPGWIYFIGCERERMVKIGCAQNPKHRFFMVKGSSPIEVQFLGAIEGNQIEERLLHRKWAKHHVRNEWFEAAPEIIEFIELNAMSLAETRD